MKIEEELEKKPVMTKDILNKHFEDFFSDRENIIKLFSHSNDAMVITDYKNRIVMVNPAFTQITGFSYEDVYMRNPRLLQSGLTPRHVFRKMWNTILSEGTWTGELINSRKNGEIYYSYITTTYIRKEREEDSYYIAISRDITEQKRTNEKIEYLAHHDTLTDLPNRNLFVKLVQEMMNEAKDVGQRMALLFIDLDRFKLINDTLGHHCGDKVLKEVGMRLAEIFGENSIVSRFGGDEFVVLLPDGRTENIVAGYLKKLFNHLRTYPVYVDNNEYFVNASVGISFFPDHGDEPDKLIQTADTAMYQSKQEGKNNFQFFSYSMKEGAYKQFLLTTQLQQALAEDQFVLYYQPQMDLKRDKLYGMEALIRWDHPVKGILSPGEFMEEAEESGLIAEIDNWVMRKALRQMKEWHDQGYDDMTISVNVSKKQFEEKNFVEKVRMILDETQINPHYVCLEITENFALIHVKQAIEKLTALKALGVKIALDDFGTGYSSLSQLIHFPIDALKIDQAFVKTSDGNDKNAALIKTIIQISRQLNLSVTCEGVETETQLRFIQKEGSDVAQGYFFSKPISVEEVNKYLPLKEGENKLREIRQRTSSKARA